MRGATEAINLVAQTYGRPASEPGDEVLISAMEHHSNIVPWQMLCEEKGARPARGARSTNAASCCSRNSNGCYGPRTRLVAVAHVSNALGTVNPVRRIDRAGPRPQHPGAGRRRPGGPAPARWTCRRSTATSTPSPGTRSSARPASACSTARQRLLEAMPPYQGGGDMISSVTFEKTIYNGLPYKFEAGTPNIAGGDRPGRRRRLPRSASGWTAIAAHEHDLLAYATGGSRTASRRAHHRHGARKRPACSRSSLDGIHPHDVGTILDQEGIAIRTGHHCAQPVMDFFGVPGHRARLAGFLQHARGNRRPGRPASGR